MENKDNKDFCVQNDDRLGKLKDNQMTIKNMETKIKSDETVWRKTGGLRQLKDGLKRQIVMDINTFQSYHISTADKQFPAKIKIFCEKANVEIAVSFTHKIADHDNCDYLTMERSTIVERDLSGQKMEMYISIFAKSQFYGYIGCAFSGIKPKEKEEVYFHIDSMDMVLNDVKK